MPLVSDPGSQLVQAAVEQNVAVFPIPGPSAVLTALVASGLESGSFQFCGFLPPKAKARVAAIKQVAGNAALSSTRLEDRCLIRSASHSFVAVQETKPP